MSDDIKKNDKNENDDIGLGGFPPIYYLNSDNKKKREFKKNIEDNVNTTNIGKFNILNIKNILGKNNI